MSAALKPGDFESLSVPLTLEVGAGEARTTVALTVKSVGALPAHRFREQPFSLVLAGPRTPLLPQATYALNHPSLGAIEIFLVPVGQDANSTQYEVTFN